MSTPPFDPEPILAQASWIRKVVREMLADEHLADDLAQDALEVGLRQGAGIRGSTRSWLYGVAKNLHLQFLRGQKRREQRELRVAVADSSDPSGQSSDLVEKMEIMQMVEQAVLSLPQAPRDLLILRYYEDHSIKQIAQMQGVSIKALDSRLARAKQLLRAQLQNRFGNNWATALLPLAASAPLTSAAISPLSILLMSKLTKVAAALAVVSLFTFIFWPDETPLDLDLESNVSPAELAVANGDTHSAGADRGNAPVSDDGTAVDHGRLNIATGLGLRIVDEAGVGIKGAEVLAFDVSKFYNGQISTHSLPDSTEESIYPTARTASLEGGIVHFPRLNADFHGALFVRADGYVWRGFNVLESPQLDETFRDLGDFALGRGGQMAFQFVDPEGLPVVGLRVYYSHFLPTALEGNLGSQTLFSNSDGIVAFNSLPLTGGYMGCTAVGFERWGGEVLAPPAGPQKVQRVVLSRGGSIPIRVVDSVGKPVKGAAIYLQSRRFWYSIPIMNERSWTGFQGHTDVDGKFEVRGLSESDKPCIRVIHGDSWMDANGREIGTSITIKLPEVHKVTGQFVFANGDPADGAKITLIDVSRPSRIGDYSEELDEEGRFTAHLRPGDYGMEVTHLQGSLQGKQPIRLEGSIDLGKQVLPEGPELNLYLIDADTGDPVESVQINFPHFTGRRYLAPADQWRKVLARARSQFNGFIVDGEQIQSRHLFPGTHQLEIEAPGYSTVMQTVELFADRPTEYTIVLHPSAELELIVMDAAGQPVFGASMDMVPETYEQLLRQHEPGTPYPQPPVQNMFGNTTNQAGKVILKDLRPGLWHLGVSSRARDGFPFTSFELKKGRNQRTVVYPQEVELTIDVQANGIPIQGVRLNLLRKYQDLAKANRTKFSTSTTYNELEELEPIPPGRYRVQVSAEGYLPVEEEVEILGAQQHLMYDLGGPSINGRVLGNASDAEVYLVQFLEEKLDLEKETQRIQEYLNTNRSQRLTMNTSQRRIACQKVDAYGQFTIHCQAPGPYFVLARAKGFFASELMPIDVPDSGISDLELALTPAATIILKVSGMREFQRAFPGAYFAPEVRLGTFHMRAGHVLEDGELLIQPAPVGDVVIEMVYHVPDTSRAGIHLEFGPKLQVQTVAGETSRLEWDAGSMLKPATADE